MVESEPNAQALHRFHWEGAGGTVRLEVAAAADLDALVTEETDPDQIPFWAVMWQSAPVLARYLLDLQPWRGVPVLELGCGTGLVGLALAAVGAQVTQTDRFRDSAWAARENARRNGLAGSARQAAADWRHWPFRCPWPAVVASDVLYERSMHGPLLDALDAALAPQGVAYLSDPLRPMSLGMLERLRDPVVEPRFQVEVLTPPERVPALLRITRR